MLSNISWLEIIIQLTVYQVDFLYLPRFLFCTNWQCSRPGADDPLRQIFTLDKSIILYTILYSVREVASRTSKHRFYEAR